MVDFIQALGSGILVGLVYALLGLSIVIIYRASEAFNFAIGEFLVIGSFLFYIFFFDLGIPLLIALPLGLLAAGLVGALVITCRRPGGRSGGTAHHQTPLRKIAAFNDHRNIRPWVFSEGMCSTHIRLTQLFLLS